ncbi:MULTISPECIES: tRNA (adenosine(37)-N6)-dimethylallyltransferase MiaA [unclassified Pedobacter]|uniref:tRNA (adenosine(37)-N6)-dimethylallyltransferase MiaA n=1 Tax=unclassified Pedobacter TaxID=2628915 RepID=UPI00141EBBA2|nr:MULTISPECIES: tRNA (adenosine(37)-N6)-dimethylallyltransferase MiaA [unclassified Pedobacter]NII81553.1 tRNA dimethylallyltransferase [Pedobacter sp. SG908]NMN35557.1 tRNA dimethylallyltransferase [Pedobacter sp. SG918]
MPHPKTLISIVGPTAIGKTALAIQLAQYFGTEIISADSRQFFKEMEIGTAKPDATELAAAKHHFINSHVVSQLFSTGDFEVEGLKILEEIFQNHDLAIMVGGSGLYVNALINGLDEMPDIDLAVRERLNKQFEEEGLSSIQKQLATLDPEYFVKVDQQNPQRMIRGLEVFLSTGRKLSSMLSATKKERPFNIIKIGLNTDRAVLYDRINRRVDQMIADGLVDEVKSLIPFKKYNALNTVGYSELFDYLDGKLSLVDAVASIKQNTRRFAKRQLTWFRRDDELTWFEPYQSAEIINFIENKITDK